MVKNFKMYGLTLHFGFKANGYALGEQLNKSMIIRAAYFSNYIILITNILGLALYFLMSKYKSLMFFIGVAFGQSTDTLNVDESFYESGNLRYQRSFKEGKAHGKWTHYYDGDNIWIQGNYNKGIQLGLWTTYYKNGQEWTKGNYKNNERSGKWFFYNEDGTVYDEKEY